MGCNVFGPLPPGEGWQQAYENTYKYSEYIENGCISHLMNTYADSYKIIECAFAQNIIKRSLLQRRLITN